MPFWVLPFIVAFASMGVTLLLAFSLDFRRINLVQSGLLPKATPEVFRLRAGLISIGMGLDLPYVFSDRLAESPDRATRYWTPWLRGGIVASIGSFVLTFVSVLFA